jgi:hypothetical protein
MHSCSLHFYLFGHFDPRDLKQLKDHLRELEVFIKSIFEFFKIGKLDQSDFYLKLFF